MTPDPPTSPQPSAVLLAVIVAGGRDYQITEADEAWLDTLPIREVVSGGASGADAGGEAWARKRGIPIRRFPADWSAHGRAAGPIRNRQMAEYAEGVVLFPGGRGTASMRREAARCGLQIFSTEVSKPHPPTALTPPVCSPSTLRIKIEGKEYTVPRKEYAIKKTAQLQEFGYHSLTVDELNEQIDALMADKKLGDGLTVIGMFMEGEVLSKANLEVSDRP